MELPEIRPEERTPLVEALLAINRQLADRVAELEQTHQQLRDEIARLKGQKPRPDIKPSVLEGAPKAQRKEGDKRPGSAKRPKTAELTIHREEPLHAEGLPEGSKFRCYESYVVQDLIIQSENTRYLRARYDLPGGGSVLAPFPEGVLPVVGGHFGPNLIAYILDQYHQAQVTEPPHIGLQAGRADVGAPGHGVGRPIRAHHRVLGERLRIAAEREGAVGRERDRLLHRIAQHR